VNRDEIFRQVRDIISEVLEQPDLQVTAETKADDVEGWDSFNHINIVVAIEARFGIKVRTAEIEELRNVGELVDVVEEHKKNKAN
jgi:acyl carrier protein